MEKQGTRQKIPGERADRLIIERKAKPTDARLVLSACRLISIVYSSLTPPIKPSYDWLIEGEAMVAVQGLYKGGDTVAIDASSLPPMNEPYKVIVTFLHPQQNSRAHSDQKSADKRQAGFETFMKYKGRLPVDFDYRKELADYREERYGRIN